ncbi:hypothetical protein ISF_05792 [Cordyceps fumosorosea ARSEF 2679]|uniref:Uncharacterized protein n=1 Tax=Cordyceps fumosorosea (strain ARSEF 2679) TaxID=1081104 RepID=A0A167TMK1_CORFA|nr:hypothetical protein ISF_05792 [Cordyceps fumosorosea ARSEF 2679]OAA60753.1 hypothetical protein ISF_05792 [Cordyceps fumosorosea ARSEF 2679]
MTDACSLREFLSHISGSKGARLKGEPYDGEELHDFRNKPLFGAGLENSADFDVDKTAMNMLDKEIGDIQCPPWCKVKDGKFLYLPSLETIAMRVGAIKATMSVEELESNKSLFHRLDTCVDGVITDRRADMSRYLIPHLRKAVKGVHPIAFRSLLGNRQLFLYGKTIQGIRDSVQGTGANAESFFRNRKKILDNAWEEYMGTKRALEHKAPIEKWGVLTARMFPVKGCEQRPAN